MKCLHVVPGLDDPSNGFAIAARLIARSQGADIIDARQFQPNNQAIRPLEQFSEIWVHGMWTPDKWLACWKVLRASGRQSAVTCRQPRLVRMPHGGLSPVYLKYQGKWKKRLVAPIERWLLLHSDRIVTTCEAERKWVRKYLGLGDCSDCSDCTIGKGGPTIEVTDLKRFFRLEGKAGKEWSAVEVERPQWSLHLLYLGRRHPLKGVRFLEQAVAQLQSEQSNTPNNRTIELRIVSDHFGEELEKDWAWCDVLCLPTLSENFGLVVAEALERGKRVITTDGATAWESPPEAAEVKVRGEGERWWNRLVYLKGYRDGTDEERVRLLKEAIERVKRGAG